MSDPVIENLSRAVAALEAVERGAHRQFALDLLSAIERSASTPGAPVQLLVECSARRSVIEGHAPGAMASPEAVMRAAADELGAAFAEFMRSPQFDAPEAQRALGATLLGLAGAVRSFLSGDRRGTN